MRRLILLLLLAPLSLFAQRQPGGISITPQWNYKVTGSDTTYQFFNPPATGAGAWPFLLSRAQSDARYALAGSTVTSVSGTANRITSTGGTTPVINISSTFEALLGKVANPLSQFAATTSAQFLGVISDESGSGLVVGNNSPTFITPTLGDASATSLNITGTSGGGYINLATNAGASIPTPTSSLNVFSSSGVAFGLKNTSGFTTTFSSAFQSADQTHFLPNNSGTFWSTTMNAGNIPYATGAHTATSLAIGTDGYLLGAVSGLPAYINYDAATRTLTNKDLSSGTNTFPTFNQNTTGSAARWTTGRTLAITGDLAYTSPSFDGSGNVTATGTLATVNSNVGSFGSSTSIPTFTVNAKGLITAASGNAVIAPAGTLTGGTLASGVTASSLTSAAGGTFGTNAFNSTAYLPLTGGTLTGVLNLTDPTNTLINVNRTSSTDYARVIFKNAGVNAWGTGLRGDASNDYVIRDEANSINALRIVNGTGDATFAGILLASNLSGTNTGDETTSRINALYGYTPANPGNTVNLTGNQTATGVKIFDKIGINGATPISTQVLSMVGDAAVLGNVASTLMTPNNIYSTSATPSISAGSAAGTSPTISVTGSNQDHVVSLHTGAALVGSGSLFTVTMSGGFAYPTECNPILSLSTYNTANGAVFGVGTTTTGYSITVNTGALLPNTSYEFRIHNGGY